MTPPKPRKQTTCNIHGTYEYRITESADCKECNYLRLFNDTIRLCEQKHNNQYTYFSYDENKNDEKCGIHEINRKKIKTRNPNFTGNSHYIIKANCNEHGIFYPKVENHCDKSRKCIHCATNTNGIKQTMKRDDFIEKSENKHGKNRYDYSLIPEITKNKISIICHQHVNEQPEGYISIIGKNQHLSSGTGCLLCSSKNAVIKRNETLQKKKIEIQLKQENDISLLENLINKKENNHEIKELMLSISNINFELSRLKIQQRKLELKFNNITIKKIKIEMQLNIRKNEVINKKIINTRNKRYIKSLIAFEEKHGKTYDYSKFEYSKSDDDSIIICRIHGEFLQSPTVHKKSGCPYCGAIKQGNRRKHTKEYFVEEAKIIHGYKYDYSYVEYKDDKTDVQIKCNRCNIIFPQTPANHKRKGNNNLGGCPTASCKKYDGELEKMKQKFITKAKKIHGENKYDYNLVNYENNKTNITIICNNCNLYFPQLPKNHLTGNGCNKCQFGNYSIGQIEWLKYLMYKNNNYILHAQNEGEFKINYKDTYYQVDGYCKETNTVYEYMGDYYHGNPLLYNRDEYNECRNTTYGELYDKTIEKINNLKKLGYNVEYIWEFEWIQMKKTLNDKEKQIILTHK